MSWPPLLTKLFIALIVTICLKEAIEGAKLPPVARNLPNAEFSQHRQPIYHSACTATSKKPPGQLGLPSLSEETDDKKM